jgi:hypothetical protein
MWDTSWCCLVLVLVLEWLRTEWVLSYVLPSFLHPLFALAHSRSGGTVATQGSSEKGVVDFSFFDRTVDSRDKAKLRRKISRVFSFCERQKNPICSKDKKRPFAVSPLTPKPHHVGHLDF